MGKFILCIILFSFCFADKIILKDKNEFIGKIIYSDSQTVHIKNNNKVVQIPREKITTIERDPYGNKFVRYSDQYGEQNLETCTKMYSHKDTGLLVSLVGVVHVGDKSYYPILQNYLDIHDLVLFEAINGPRITADLSKVDIKKEFYNKQFTEKKLKEHGLSVIAEYDLSFQIFEINYNRNFWFCSDMTREEMNIQKYIKKAANFLSIKKEVQKYKINIDSYYHVVKHLLINPAFTNEPMQKHFKIYAAVCIANYDMYVDMDEHLRFLIYDRNNYAYQIFKEAEKNPKLKSIALFYGVGHMVDFEERLLASGYKEESEIWDVAWEID